MASPSTPPPAAEADRLSPGAMQCINHGIKHLEAGGPADQQAARYLAALVSERGVMADQLAKAEQRVHASRWRRVKDEAPPDMEYVRMRHGDRKGGREYHARSRCLNGATAPVWQRVNGEPDRWVQANDWWQPISSPEIADKRNAVLDDLVADAQKHGDGY